jgi:hypothetical protein
MNVVRGSLERVSLSIGRRETERVCIVADDAEKRETTHSRTQNDGWSLLGETTDGSAFTGSDSHRPMIISFSNMIIVVVCAIAQGQAKGEQDDLDANVDSDRLLPSPLLPAGRRPQAGP